MTCSHNCVCDMQYGCQLLLLLWHLFVKCLYDQHTGYRVTCYIAYCFERHATGWTVCGSNPVAGEIFHTRPDPTLLNTACGVTQRRLIATDVSGETYRSHLKGSTARSLKMGKIGCPKMAVTTNLFCLAFQKSEDLTPRQKSQINKFIYRLAQSHTRTGFSSDFCNTLYV